MNKLKQMIKFFRKKSKEKAWQWEKFVSDPRGLQGRRWQLMALLNGLFVGLLAGCLALRDAERLTNRLGKWRSRLGIGRRIPDTTMRDTLVRLDAKEFRPMLHLQIKEELRSKRIRKDALPIGVVSIDNKTLGTGEVDFHPQAQVSHKTDGTAYGHLRAVRTVLISSSLQLCLDQDLIPKETNEKGFFSDYWKGLLSVYGHTDLFEVVSLDAGFSSRENADLIAKSNRAYVIALKENQPELFAKAERLFQGLYDKEQHQFIVMPEAQTEWEPYQGEEVRRSLFRSRDMAGYLDWEHLEQVWLIVQEKRDKGGKIRVEYHYRISSLLWDRLQAVDCLRLVRLHWGIENGCNWTLDTQWHEDQKAWCGEGNGVEVLSWLRLLAYNLSQMLRQWVLKEAGQAAMAWRDLFDWVRWYLYKGRPDLSLEEELALVDI